MKKNLLTALLALSSFSGFGAGYQLNLQGLRQLAMGGSGTAWPWDASTIFYNPGGLSRLDGVQAYGSMCFIMPKVAFADTGTGHYKAYTKSQTFVPFNIYIGGPVKEGSRVGLGLGIYTPFGSGLSWDDNWAGRYMVQSIKLQSIFIQPTISYRINDVLSIGAGVIYATGTLDYRIALPVQNENGLDGEAHLHGNANGVGANIGLQIKANDNLQFGVTYRSRVNMRLNAGRADFDVASSLQSYFPTTSFKSNLPLPEVASVGIGYKIGKRLILQADLNLVGWQAYDSLKFDFNQQTSELQNMHAPRHYANTLAVRIGGHYKLGKVSIMAGAAYDPSPTQQNYVSPELPDANRINLTCGIAYRPIHRLAIVAAYEYSRTIKRTGNYVYDGFSGQYQTVASTPGIGVSYDF